MGILSKQKRQCERGFTLIELVMVIVLLSILSVVAYSKWPTGMDVEAANLEFKQAVRYAQHMALTREWTTPAEAWGITTSGNKYYVGRANANCVANCNNNSCADELYCGRSLIGDDSMTIEPSATTVLSFNGLGEPIASDGTFLGNTRYTIAGQSVVEVCQQTGYVMEGASCP